MNEPVLTGPARFEFAPRPAGRPPRPGAGQARVRVLAGGICGSDLPFFRGAPIPSYARTGLAPLGYPLHEIVGVLQDLGPGTTAAARVGELVVGWATAFDGLASEVVTDAASLAACPGRWPPEEAVLIQPLACVLYTMERIGSVAGRRCAVLGLGPIGLLFAHVLTDRGAASVIGVDRVNRSEIAAEFGVDELHWSTTERWAATAAGDRPEVILEAVGHQVSTLQHALTAVADSGLVFCFGVNDDPIYPLDMDQLLRKNLTLMAGGTQHRARMLGEATGYLDRYPQLIEQTITHRFPRDEVQRAYELAATSAPGRLKVVIRVADGAE